MLVMQALGGSRRLRPSGGSAGPNHNAPPFVVVLAGECRAGGYAIATARMLANHECNVVVCWTGGGGGGGGGDAGVVAEHGGGSINGAMQDGSPRAEDIKSIEGQNILPQLDVLPSSGARLVDAASGKHDMLKYIYIYVHILLSLPYPRHTTTSHLFVSSSFRRTS